jgi:hypothetical protein
MNTYYANAVNHLQGKDVVTIATGATCAYLGDERNLREFVIADEVARCVRKNGQTAVTLLIDDSLDPLNYRQLRVAVNKDPDLMEKHEKSCGKPIAYLPDPWGCCESYADHFEQELLARLHYLDCHPTLIRTAKLYERGVYKPFVKVVFERYHEIFQFLDQNFHGYHPEKLFWVICTRCGYIDETTIEDVKPNLVRYRCARCDRTESISVDDLRGKLNWKLDCAARWVICNVDAEAFNKGYMEPQTGSYHISQALSRHFFQGHDVLPLYYGLIKMENKFSLQLIDSLPRGTLRQMLSDHPVADIKLTRDLVVTVASRFEVMPGMTYRDFVKQLLPMWLMTPDQLQWRQRELVTHGIAFSRNFLREDTQLQLPRHEHFDGEKPEVLRALCHLFQQTAVLRAANLPNEEFTARISEILGDLGPHKMAVLKRLRTIVGQEKGMAAARILLLLPSAYLQMILFVLELILKNEAPTANGETRPDEDAAPNGSDEIHGHLALPLQAE